MEIKVGEYVRLKRGEIFKIDENTTNYYNSNEEFITNEIVKHSKNIIDIIEVGDYVNGERVFATESRINDNGKKVILVENYDEWTDNGVIANKDIKTIVTHEQFAGMEYKV